MLARCSFFVLLFAICTLGSTALGQGKTTDSIYQYKKASYGGTGKFFMGREIAEVMSFEGADWLERDTRQQEENTAAAISKLPVSNNSNVADIGAGTGYYTFRIASRVPQGKVYAVEIQNDAIAYLKKKSKELNKNNVVVIKGDVKSPNLPYNVIDVALMVDVYHELTYPYEILQAIRRSLKPHGKLVLLEYRAEDPQIAIKELHKMSVKQVNKELAASGFHLVKDEEFLPIQHFLVYEKNWTRNRNINP